MMLKIGKADYPHKHPVGQASLRGTRPNRPVPLVIVTMKDMRDLHRRLQHLSGVPSAIAYDEKAQLIWLHPKPNGEYELDLVDLDLVDQTEDPKQVPSRVLGSG